MESMLHLCLGTSPRPLGFFSCHNAYLACHYYTFFLLSVINAGGGLGMALVSPGLLQFHVYSNFKTSTVSGAWSLVGL